MSNPSGSDAVKKAAATSSTTLTMPQVGEPEKGFQTRNHPIDDPNKDTEAQSSAEKEQALEDEIDEEWLENPAHPRNWPSTKKWTNMAIVSRSLPRPFVFPAASYFRNFRFHSTRLYLRSQVQ